MAAIAPLLQEPATLEAPAGTIIEPLDPAALDHQIAEQNLLLAREREIPESVRLFVEDLADDVAVTPLDATWRTDPYLLVALQKALIAALRTLDNPDPALARRDLRIRLEQVRQVYRDLADARPIYEDRPAGELVRWLASVVDVPQARLAELFGVSPRTFQRWLSETDPSEPVDEDARRIRVVANLVGHLRHALTGQGVIAWFERGHPLIDGRSPRELLDQPDALPQLMRLAASTRSAIAS
jgi:hypothetical protein